MATIRNILARGAIAAALLALAACGGSAPDADTAGKGRVKFVMAAADATAAGPLAPLGEDDDGEHDGDHDCAPALQAATVTFSSIVARTLDGDLVDVTIDLPVTLDLLSLGPDRTLPAGFLPPGTYDQLVVVMSRAELTLRDGTAIAITPPGGGWTAIVRVAEPFTVVEGETTTVTLRFRRELSFGCGDGRWEWHPRFDCDGR